MKIIFLALCLMLLNFANAQGTKKIRIQTIENGIVKTGYGEYYVLSMVNQKVMYSVIITTKDLIRKSSKITLFIERINDEPEKYNLENNPENIIQSSNEKNILVAIPYDYIVEKLPDRRTFKNAIFSLEDFIPDNFKNTSDADIEELKKAMEVWINN